LLNDDECIHHKDEDRMNNEFDNLELMEKDVHSSYHTLKRGKNMVTIKCPKCGYVFNRARRNTHLVKKKSHMTFYSKKCIGKFSFHTKKLNIKDRIKIGRESIIREYIG